MKTCNSCGTELKVGENWAPSRARNYNYHCDDCARGIARSNYKPRPKGPRSSPEYVKQHLAVSRRRGVAYLHDCVDCGKKAEQWSHKHGTDREEVVNYDPRCIPCHIKYDTTE